MWFFVFLLSNLFAFAANQTLVVTGGAGFMGSNFVQYMYKKHPEYNIVVLDNLSYSGNLENIPSEIRSSERFSFVRGSICDKKVVEEVFKKANFVVHFAAQTDVGRSISDDEVFFETNVMGTRNLMHYLVKYKNRIKRFIHISSSEVYGTCEGKEMDEEHPLNPRSPYAASKAGADRTVYAYSCTYHLPVVILRFFNNYGPHQHVEKVIPKFVTFAINKEPLVIHGTGMQTRDFIHVVDMARAVDAALHVADFESIRNQAINCGTGKITSVKEIAEAVSSHFGLEATLLVYGSDRPGQVDKHLSSTAKAKRLLGWEALIPFEEGIQMTIKWYEEHPEHWEKTISDSQIHKDNTVLIQEKIKR
jgi:dTDP-glucose 4,6-dehydratase